MSAASPKRRWNVGRAEKTERAPSPGVWLGEYVWGSLVPTGFCRRPRRFPKEIPARGRLKSRMDYTKARLDAVAPLAQDLFSAFGSPIYPLLGSSLDWPFEFGPERQRPGSRRKSHWRSPSPPRSDAVPQGEPLKGQVVALVKLAREQSTSFGVG